MIKHVLQDSDHLAVDPLPSTLAASYEDFLGAMHRGPTSSDYDLLWSSRSSRLVGEGGCNVLILHSSGTTGYPKPISLAQRYMLGYAACHEFLETQDEAVRGINPSM